ncbi:hypothetical protein B0H16DRAFT_1474205 [Mycena metata]|uniref:Uncharacterized protein n=1 Tax=Mycena metata TaxID=1033252 RepID=A0AAD7HHD2_9AGAR|nr:hypothetical protein B0H16DRAFT_1474205 [Mycena metata]
MSQFRLLDHTSPPLPGQQKKSLDMWSRPRIHPRERPPHPDDAPPHLPPPPSSDKKEEKDGGKIKEPHPSPSAQSAEGVLEEKGRQRGFGTKREECIRREKEKYDWDWQPRKLVCASIENRPTTRAGSIHRKEHPRMPARAVEKKFGPLKGRLKAGCPSSQMEAIEQAKRKEEGERPIDRVNQPEHALRAAFWLPTRESEKGWQTWMPPPCRL